MGVKPVTKYPVNRAYYEGEPSYNTQIAKRLGARWIVYTQCTNIETGTWVATLMLQIKVGSGRSVDKIFAEDNQFGINVVSTRRRNSDGTPYATEGFPVGGWYTIYLEDNGSRISRGYVENGTVCLSYTTATKRLQDEISTTVTFNNADIKQAFPKTPVYEYGGIDYTMPSILTSDITVSNITQTSATASYSFTAPYDCEVDIFLMDVYGQVIRYTQEIEKPTLSGSVSYSNLLPAHTYWVVINIKCENAKTASATGKAFATEPIYVDAIICPNEIYVNENETIRLIPETDPANASYKTFEFKSDASEAYKLSQSKATQTLITGISPSVDAKYIDVVATDAHKVTKRVNVYVCRPATRIVTSYSRRRVPMGGTYQILYDIIPAGSTDTSVTFQSSDTSIATVSANGVVTAQSEGEAVITLSLAKRITDDSGIITDTTYLTTTLTIVVSGDPEYDEWWEQYQTTFIDTDYVDSIFENYSALRNAINGYQYEKEGTVITVDIPAFVSPQTQDGRSTPIYDVSQCLNAIETAMDLLYVATNEIPDDIITYEANAAYGQSYRWEGVVTTPQAKRGRWAEYMMYLHLFCLENNLM